MAGTKTKQHAEAIGRAMRKRFQESQDIATLEQMIRLYGEGRSLSEVAESVGKPLTTVARWLKGAGVATRTPSQARTGKAWSPARRAATPEAHKPEPVIVDGRALRGAEILRHRAIGNKSITKQGYVVVQTADGRRYEHDIVAEAALGRALAPGEVVHHINCIRHDNRPENLLICTRPYHQSLHARMRRDPYWRDIERQAKTSQQPE